MHEFLSVRFFSVINEQDRAHGWRFTLAWFGMGDSALLVKGLMGYQN